MSSCGRKRVRNGAWSVAAIEHRLDALDSKRRRIVPINNRATLSELSLVENITSDAR